MNKLIAFNRKTLAVLALLIGPMLLAQSMYKESFNVGQDVVVEVNTTHTDVVFETWNKNTVEVEAFVEGEGLSEADKEKIFENWSFDVLGNSKKVVISSNEGSLWGGFESLGSLNKLSELKELESLQGLAALQSLKALEGLKDIDFNIMVPDIPNLDKLPVWPFSNHRPSVHEGDGEYSYFTDKGKRKFDRSEYDKNKQAYVAKLNKKYNKNVSVSEVDSWLNAVDAWGDEIGEVMEKWGEEFGTTFEEKFGPEFELKMEKWGEEFGEDMEKWGEKFGKSMEKWGEEFGESFGKEMEAWGEKFGEEAEKWAEQFDDDDNYSKEQIIDEHGNKKTIIRGSKNGNSLFNKARKKIIIKMPKGTKTDVNVRHGELKMADAYNMKATLNYATLIANSIDGGQTLINASYAPVSVNNWLQGTLYLKYVDDCKINNIGEIDLLASSSDININRIIKRATLSGSFGNLFVNEVSNDFETIDIVLENTDATITMPKSAFLFDYHGKRSRFSSPASLEFTSKNKKDKDSAFKGFFKSKSANRAITITAAYSNVIMQ